MYNLGDDKELDRLSREAAGRYTAPGEANWQALSEELDRIMPVTEKKKRRFLFWWLLPLLLIGGGAAYWMGSNPSTGEATHPGAASPTRTRFSKETKETNPVTASQTTAETDQQLSRETAQPVAKASVQNAAPGSTEMPTKALASTPAIKTSFSNQKSSQLRIPVTNNRSSGIKEMADHNQPRSTSTNNNTNAVDKKADIPLLNTQPVTEKTVTVTTAEPSKAEAVQPPTNTTETTTTQTTITEPVTTEEATPAPVAKLNSRPGKGFSYAFVAGVDKSTVKFVYGNDPGINLGMMAGYHFNNRWSVHTGLIYTQKNYKVAGKDFTAPKGTWVSYYNLENVTGYCRMWEVPLQVRYTLGKTEKKSSFFSAGLSSYFMTKESYDYFYYYNNQPVTRHSTLDSDDQHLLSIAHFSVGFENKISKKWALQVEPYAKIPLGGVGYGSIRLSSFGLNFSLQHRQPARK